MLISVSTLHVECAYPLCCCDVCVCVCSVTVVFVDRDGVEHSVQAKVGDTLLEVAKQYDIDVEGEQS